MSIMWDHYRERFSLGTTAQRPLSEAQCHTIEHLVGEDCLQLSPTNRMQVWGDPSLPGLFASTVLHFLLPVDQIGNPLLQERIRTWEVPQIGIKIYKSNAPAFLEFHQKRSERGEPLQTSPFIQKSLWAGLLMDRLGKRRGVVVQQWVDGCSLDQFCRSLRAKTPLSGTKVRRLLNTLYSDIVPDVWHASSLESGVVWDWRPGNIVVSRDRCFLSLIDSDCLRPLVTPIKNAAQRTTNEKRGFAYIQTTTSTLLAAQGLSRRPDSLRADVKRHWEASGFGEALSLLGQVTTPDEADRQRDVVRHHAYHFLEALHHAGVLL